jgi:hypothetical protein
MLFNLCNLFICQTYNPGQNICDTSNYLTKSHNIIANLEKPPPWPPPFNVDCIPRIRFNDSSSNTFCSSLFKLRFWMEIPDERLAIVARNCFNLLISRTVVQTQTTAAYSCRILYIHWYIVMSHCHEGSKGLADSLVSLVFEPSLGFSNFLFKWSQIQAVFPLYR